MSRDSCASGDPLPTNGVLDPSNASLDTGYLGDIHCARALTEPLSHF